MQLIFFVCYNQKVTEFNEAQSVCDCNFFGNDLSQ